MEKGEPRSENKFVAKRCGMNYYRYDARLGSWRELTEKEFNRAIKKKYVLPVWDDYWQRFSEKTFVDTRDSIVRIFYIKGERRADDKEIL